MISDMLERSKGLDFGSSEDLKSVGIDESSKDGLLLRSGSMNCSQFSLLVIVC